MVESALDLQRKKRVRDEVMALRALSDKEADSKLVKIVESAKQVFGEEQGERIVIEAIEEVDQFLLSGVRDTMVENLRQES